MTPSASPSAPLAPDWAFVLQLRERTPLVAEQLQGRIEHVTSGKATNFDSLAQALEFVRLVLADISRRPQ